MWIAKLLLFSFFLSVKSPALEAMLLKPCDKFIENLFAERHPLSPINPLGREIRRSYVNCRGQSCVILEGPPILPDPNAERLFMKAAKREANPEILGRVIRTNNDGWFACTNFFNCHSFVLRRHFPLRVTDWIEGSNGLYTLANNPLSILLNAFFVLVGTSDEKRPNFLHQLHTAVGLQNGDIVAFVAHSSDGEIFVHSMEIQKKQKQIWVRSKLGQGVVVEGTLLSHILTYKNSFDEIRVYRRKSQEF